MEGSADEIRSTGGRYASYWEAFLFIILLIEPSIKLFPLVVSSQSTKLLDVPNHCTLETLIYFLRFCAQGERNILNLSHLVHISEV